MAAPDRQPKKTIRQLRQERGWSQLELAVRIGVSQSNITRWERGTVVPQRGHLLSLARAFGVPVAAIAFGPAEPASRSEE